MYSQKVINTLDSCTVNQRLVLYVSSIAKQFVLHADRHNADVRMRMS